MAKLSKEEREALKEQLSKEAAALDAKKTKKRTFIMDIPQEDKEELIVLEEKQEEDSEWDVKIGDPIEYFDPELSYELTGYRPITKDKGLDFNPDDFTEMARTYEETGEYTSLIPGTVMFADLCYRELDRCMNGMTVGKYHITGDNYFWLNYYRMKSVVGIKGAATGRNETFPTFIAKLYEYFHYMELAAKLKKDVVAFKSRGVGASEISASISVNLYTAFENTRVMATAPNDFFVDKLTDKMWTQLNFLNTHTKGMFAHQRMVIDTANFKRASVLDEERNESGWMSEIEGKVADVPDKVRGDRTDKLLFEEAGSNKHLIASWIKGEALTEINGIKFGIRYAWGTGGDSGPNLEGLTRMFYNPVKYKVLPYKNRYNEAQEVAYTGYFIPAYTMWFGEQDKGEIGYDNRGVVDEERAKKYYMDRRALLINDPKDLMMYKAEYCFTPEEALILEGENKFDKERLSTLLANIEIHKLFEPPQGITLRFRPMKDDPHLVDRFSVPEFEYDSRSKIKIVELPVKDSNGLVPSNLYVAGIDSIDNDTSTSSGQSDVSEFCIIIFKRMMGITPPKPVAIYKERPKDIRIAFDNAIKLMRMYNCKGLIEATKISLVTYFKEKKCADLLLKRPRATMPTIRKANPNQYGTPATDDIINHQLDLINDYITDYCEYIEFPELLNELLRYSYANKRKFDMVAGLGMCLLANEDMIGKTIQQSVPQASQEEIGWYTDEYGYKHFGKIPKQQVIQRNEQFRRAGSWFSRNALLLQVPKKD